MTSLANLFDLSGRVALITGGSRGLGFQIASALSEFGADVALVARKEDELNRAAEQLRVDGVRCKGFAADLAMADQIPKLVAAVMDEFGRIDIVVNNAGAAWGAPAETYPIEAWTKVIDLNLTGLFRLTQAVAVEAFLPQGGGSVINVASIEGLVGHHHERPGTIAYNAAKGGVVNLTRALAAEWGPKKIRVNALAPGFFPSKMTSGTLAEHGDEMIRQTPLGKLGGEDDLKGAALLLASDAGGHITGQTLVIDGGATVI